MTAGASCARPASAPPLSWTWPGLTAARSRKAPNLAGLLDSAAAAVEAKLPPAVSPSLHERASIGTLVAALAPGERERLYAAGALAGPRWQPTPEPRLNALFKTWVFSERAVRSKSARAAGGTEDHADSRSASPGPGRGRAARRSGSAPTP